MNELIESINPSALKQALEKKDKKVELVDVRNFDEFQQMRLPNARLISLPELTLRVGEIDTSKEVYVFCKGGPRSKQASQMLKKLGISAPYLEGGITAWQKAGYPVIEGELKKALSVDQQTRIAIGTLVLLGLLIPQIWWLSWFVAIMLIIAGATNTCMLMSFLAAMPWNKAGNAPK